MHACSRNARLSVEARAKAPAIYRALQSAQQSVASGSESEPGRLGAQVALTIEAAGGKIDYIEVGELVWGRGMVSFLKCEGRAVEAGTSGPFSSHTQAGPFTLPTLLDCPAPNQLRAPPCL